MFESNPPHLPDFLSEPLDALLQVANIRGCTLRGLRHSKETLS